MVTGAFARVSPPRSIQSQPALPVAYCTSRVVPPPHAAPGRAAAPTAAGHPNVHVRRCRRCAQSRLRSPIPRAAVTRLRLASTMQAAAPSCALIMLQPGVSAPVAKRHALPPAPSPAPRPLLPLRCPPNSRSFRAATAAAGAITAAAAADWTPPLHTPPAAAAASPAPMAVH